MLVRAGNLASSPVFLALMGLILVGWSMWGEFSSAGRCETVTSVDVADVLHFAGCDPRRE